MSRKNWVAGADLRLQNPLNTVGERITVGQSPDCIPVWNGEDPADFGTDLAKLQTARSGDPQGFPKKG